MSHERDQPSATPLERLRSTWDTAVTDFLEGGTSVPDELRKASRPVLPAPAEGGVVSARLMTPDGMPFADWSERFMKCAQYTGTHVPDVDARVSQLVALWHEPILPGWERADDARLLDASRRYLRTHTRGDQIPRGEHAIEHDILCPSPADPSVRCLGARLVDGINAVPLARDPDGGRAANVEADMALLVRDNDSWRVLLVEVKVASNNAWYAAVENLRQLKLFTESEAAQRLFHNRQNQGLPATLATTAVVLAPLAFYTAAGAQGAAVVPAERLFTRIRDETGYDARIATWDASTRAIEPYAVG